MNVLAPLCQPACSSSSHHPSGRAKLPTSLAVSPRHFSNVQAHQKASGSNLASPQRTYNLSVKALQQSLSPKEDGPTASTSATAAEPKKLVDSLFYTKQGTPEQRVWRVRPYAPADFSALVQLQTDSFHTPLPLQAFDKLAKMSLRAEVLDGLRQKEKHSNPDSYVVLVADDVTAEWQEAGLQAQEPLDTQLLQPGNEDRRVQAVVEVRVEVMREDDKEVLAQLEPGMREYTYISSMAVAAGSRRQGLASSVLAAAEQQSQIWGQPHVALHVYEDNEPAIKMYTKMGMHILRKDPFLKKVLGGRIRLLMYKYLDVDKAPGSA